MHYRNKCNKIAEMYNHISKVTDQIFFGKYIDDDVLAEIKEAGVHLIVDTTTPDDDLRPYQHDDIKRVCFPIPDMYVVSDQQVIQLVQWLKVGLFKGGKVYVHCKGGHGRSGVIAACLYGTVFNQPGTLALDVVHNAHQERKVMKDKWRALGCPQTYSQTRQVLRILG